MRKNVLLFSKRYIFTVLVIPAILLFYFSSVCAQEKQKGALIIVGDANLTYASYLFELPSGWVPGMNKQLMQYTDERGFWRGETIDGQTAVTIVPAKKESGQDLANFINTAKQNNMNEAGCSSDSMGENLDFKPLISYPYRVYNWNCPKGTYGLTVFVELPQHIIFFNLSGRGNDAKCIAPYFEDFKKMLASFKWTLEAKK